MVRLILIGVGVISTAIGGYIAQRKLFRRRGDELPPELRIYQPSPRPRKRKARCSSFNEHSDNGEHEPGPTA